MTTGIDLSGKHVLDVTCGFRGIWFNKENPAAVYCDRRSEEHRLTFTQGTMDTAHGRKSERHLEIRPDVIADFTDLPFPDNSFDLVVFDPPHMSVAKAGTGWCAKAYSALPDDWRKLIRDGMSECFRVVRTFGVVVFKWSDVEFSTRQVIDAIGVTPLFGHRSGKKMNTHWMCFMKGV